MKKLMFAFIISGLLLMIAFSTGSCTDKKPVADTVVVDSLPVDTTPADTMEKIISEEPMPKAADELFDDFFFNFAASRKVQMERINFPLAWFDNDKQTKSIEKKQWKMDHFFMNDGYYTLIFDMKKDLKLVKDTSIEEAMVERIMLKTKKVLQYNFKRVNGQWRMVSIAQKSFHQSINASFLDFYQKFAVDSAFQEKSMADLVTFTAPDPDNEFEDITGSMTPEQWPAFKPALIPHGMIYNIRYGQKYVEGNRKILLVRGIANGMEIEMDFRKIGGKWKLTRFTS